MFFMDSAFKTVKRFGEKISNLGYYSTGRKRYCTFCHNFDPIGAYRCDYQTEDYRVG